MPLKLEGSWKFARNQTEPKGFTAYPASKPSRGFYPQTYQPFLLLVDVLLLHDSSPSRATCTRPTLSNDQPIDVVPTEVKRGLTLTTVEIRPGNLLDSAAIFPDR